MASGKKSFLFYVNWLQTFENLTDDEAGRLIKHLLRYVNDLNPEPPDRLTQLVFEPLKQILKVDLKKYENIVERNRTNGSKGGRPKKDVDETQGKDEKPKKPTGKNKNPKKPKKPDIDTDTDIDIDKVLPKGSIIISGEKTPATLHTVCKNLFIEKFRQLFGEEYYWEAKDGANLNPIIKKIRFNREKKEMPIDDESISVAFSLFLDSITDKWLLENFSIPNINSKFNEIISQAKNGRTKQQNTRPSPSELEAAVEIGMALAAGNR